MVHRILHPDDDPDSSDSDDSDSEPSSPDSDDSAATRKQKKEKKKAYEIQQRIFWKKQEVKDLKERSLWNKSFDSVVLLIVRMCFTVLERIKIVFDIGNCCPSSLSRSVSASASALVTITWKAMREIKILQERVVSYRLYKEMLVLGDMLCLYDELEELVFGGARQQTRRRSAHRPVSVLWRESRGAEARWSML